MTLLNAAREMEPDLENGFVLYQQISKLRGLGVKFFLQNGRLTYRIPKGAAESEFNNFLGADREEILKWVLLTGSFETKFREVTKYKTSNVKITRLGVGTQHLVNSVMSGHLGINYSHSTRLYFNVNVPFDRNRIVEASKRVILSFDILSSTLIIRRNIAFLRKARDVEKCIQILDCDDDPIRCVREVAARPFELNNFQIKVIVSPRTDGFIFALVLNHALHDSESPAIVANAFANAYINADEPLKIGMQYFDYLRAKFRWEKQGDGENIKRYWNVVLQGAQAAALPLPLPKKNLESPVYYCVKEAKLSGEASRRLVSLSVAKNVPLSTVFFSALIWAYLDIMRTNDASIGTIDSARQEVGLDVVPGCFLQILLLRAVRFPSDNLISFLERISNVYAAAKNNRSISLYDTYFKGGDTLFIKRFPLVNFYYRSDVKAEQTKGISSSEEVGPQPFYLDPFDKLVPRPEFQLSQDIRIEFSTEGTNLIGAGISTYTDQENIDTLMDCFNRQLSYLANVTRRS